MTEQMIECCLERLAICKTTDVMNFDYAGTLAYIYRLKAENATLRERLEKAVELPFPVGSKVWIIRNKEQGFPCSVVSLAFIGGNDKYAFLSPFIYGETVLRTADSLCGYYFEEYKNAGEECRCVVVPYQECFIDRESALARLSELKKEGK